LLAVILLFPPYDLSGAWHDTCGCTAFIFIADPIPKILSPHTLKFNPLAYCTELMGVGSLAIFSWSFYNRMSKQPPAHADWGCPIAMICIMCMLALFIVLGIMIGALAHEPLVMCPGDGS